MINIVPHQENGNGQGSVNGRGVLRRKLTTEARAALAADIAMGESPLTPSIKQTAALTGVSVYHIRKELKTRAKALEDLRRAERIRDEAQYIADVWSMASIQVQQEAIRRIGLCNLQDAIISVLIG